MDLLKIENLSVAFPFETGDHYAIKDISFSLRENEILGIVGESGCGKSVTVQTILGIQHYKAIIKSGSIKLNDVELLHGTEKDWMNVRTKQISIVFQEPMTTLNPLMKVGKQIEEVLKIHSNLPKNKRIELVIQMMKKVGLKNAEELFYSYPHELSGGMQQRISIAMALISNPKILIADEATTALDATIQSQILDLFKDIKKQYHGSVLFISHDLTVISKICQRVIVMYAGRIVEVGSTEDILSNPSHPYTQGLIQAVPSYNKRGSKLYNIPGYVKPLQERSEKGCPFYDRCLKRFEPCSEEFPEAYKTGSKTVFCHLYGKKE